MKILKQNFINFFRGKKRQKNIKFEKNKHSSYILKVFFAVLSHSYKFNSGFKHSKNSKCQKVYVSSQHASTSILYFFRMLFSLRSSF